MRTACYARFSSDLQRETSLEDQIRSCREYADRFDWTWQHEQVYRDAAVSGASIEGRPGLEALLTAAAARPLAFDVLLVDDSSRVARDLADALRVLQRLRFAGVRVIYISQNIDSTSEQAETLVAVHGLVDGLYLREMAQKIRRGLRGQHTRGFATGGRTYGYRSVVVPDRTRKDAPLGYRLEIEPAEADTVRQIYTWFADGLSAPGIIDKLTAADIPGPSGHPWRIGAVRHLLANQRYLGRQIWGQRRFERQPGTRKKVPRQVPASEWSIAERPDLRIVSDELWRRVQARRNDLISTLARQRQPGRNLLRGGNARIYAAPLLSGFAKCGVCGKSVTIVGNHTVKGVRYRYYGCAHSIKNGLAACPNRVMARCEVAERAILAGLQAELMRPETVAYVVERVSAALQAYADQRPKQRDALVRQRDQVQQKIGNLLVAIESGMTSTNLLAALKHREAEAARLEAEIAALDGPTDDRLAVMPTWVAQQLSDVADLLADVPERVKAEFARLDVRFTLFPVYDDGPRPYLRAVGEGHFEHLAFPAGLALPTPDASSLRSTQRTERPRHARPRDALPPRRR